MHETDILGAERWLFGGVEPTVWLQHRLYRPDRVFWYDAGATLVYTSQFIAAPVLGYSCGCGTGQVGCGFITRVVALSVAGLITYIVFPEAPPWMAARDGWSEPVARLSARGWVWLHIGNVNYLLAHAQSAGSNPVAAMPSIHAAFATLITITLVAWVRSARRTGRTDVTSARFTGWLRRRCWARRWRAARSSSGPTGR